MRLFIAINFNDSTINKLLDCQDRLKKLGKGSFTSRDNLHLTLAFLGEVEEDRVEVIKEVMDGVIVSRMKLTFSKVGCFRNDDELWWIGAEDNEELTKLQKNLTAALIGAGFSPDLKKFKPHITLSRRMRLGHIDTSLLLPKPFSATACSISLMLSHRPDGKLTYTELYRKSSD